MICIMSCMAEALAVLPDNINDLKCMVVARDEEIGLLYEQIRYLRAELFGRKTEQTAALSDQLGLFSPEETAAEPPENKQRPVSVPSHDRKKPGRKPLPPDLPRFDVVHDIPDEDKVCACGCEMEAFDEEVTEQLDIEPAKAKVWRHIRLKYACPHCVASANGEPSVEIAPPPAQLIPKSIAAPGLLAHIFTAKFADALPFYRQETQFKRLGIELSRASMGNWAIKIAQKCMPMRTFLVEELLTSPVIQIDETGHQVLNEPGRPNKRKSFMWVARGVPPGRPIILFTYQETRSSEFPCSLLADYTGYVQTDGYSGYDFLDRKEGVVHLACWAHARRKFVNVIKARGKQRRGKPSHADTALDFIHDLYRIEKSARKQSITDDALLERRQSEAIPILTKMKAWLDAWVDKIPPKSLLGKAIHYALKNWSRLIRYVEAPYLSMDNNHTENAIRPFVVGRKNWLFSGSPEGAEASALFFTLIETAKANGWEPYAYLRFMLLGLLEAETDDAVRALLPTVPPPEADKMTPISQ